MRPRMNESLSPFFHELTEYPFQDLCCELFARQSGIATCDVYGRRGQKQRGIDLWARRIGGDGAEVGQCKCYQEFPHTEIKNASDEFFTHFQYWHKRDVRRFILFVACDLDNTRQQEEIHRQTERFAEHNIKYEAWSARMLRTKLAPHRDIVSRHIKVPYWVDHICGPSMQTTPDQFQAQPNLQLTIGSSNAQLERLAVELSEYVKTKLEKIREQYREGHKREAYSSLRALQQETSWGVLEKPLQARILRTTAIYTLNVEMDIATAQDLAEEARKIDLDGDDTVLRTLLRYHTEGPGAALKEIGIPQSIDSFNLEVALLLELGRVIDAQCKLEHLPTGILPDTETKRLHALLSLMNGDLVGAQTEIQQVLAERPKWEAIQVTHAIVNYFSALSQAVVPPRVVAWPQPVDWAFVRRDDQSLQCLRRAEAEFAELSSDHARDDDSRRWLEVWRLACLSNDPDRQTEAESFCLSLLERDPTNHRALVWAMARNYNVDLAASEKALEACIEEDENGRS